MSGEVEKGIRERFEGVTDDLAGHVAMEAHGRVAAATERARLAEVEAVICAEIAGMSVRVGAKNLGMGMNRAQRLRESYRRAAAAFPDVRDDVVGMRLLLAGWPTDPEGIEAAVLRGAWEPWPGVPTIEGLAPEEPRRLPLFTHGD